MTERQLAAFWGTVQCRRENGAVRWCLAGVERAGRGAPAGCGQGVGLEVLVSGAERLDLPAQLEDVEVFEREEAGHCTWELRSKGRVLPCVARAVQVHRGADAAFAQALPAVRSAWSVRIGWILLLNLLRIPGMAHLLATRR